MSIFRKRDVFNKSGLLVFFLLAGLSASGQLIKGKVVDAHTERPLEGISIKIKYGKTLSGNTGEFSLIVSEADTIWFSGVGYESKYIIARDWKGEEMKIALKPVSVDLDEVVISGTRRNHKADSLKLRQEFAKEFNYQQPRFKDLFVNTSPSANRGRFEYVTLDVLQLVSLLGRKNNPQNKLKRRLLEDEEQAYIASRFSKSLVSSVTKLSGDSLQLFMDRYSPTRAELLNLSDYDLLKKIQENLVLFKKD